MAERAFSAAAMAFSTEMVGDDEAMVSSKVFVRYMRKVFRGLTGFDERMSESSDLTLFVQSDVGDCVSYWDPILRSQRG